jgi:eukaryotic-like serine/threonine-protein kinase
MTIRHVAAPYPARMDERLEDPSAAATDPTPAADWDFAEGTPIAPGRTTLKPLGGGSRFEVYLVWDERRFALMVAKILRPGLVEDARALRDLAEEAEALERLAHPVILRGFDAVLAGPHPHVLVEHLEGPTLRRLIRRGGALPLEQLLPLALHVAAALHYMAGEGMVHLDVKPDNIVMGVPPRLIDLSIARDLDRAARLASPLGTDAYMAPEQCDPGSHAGEIGSPADVWGLGATLHHAVSGGVPFPRPKGARDSDDPLLRFPQLHDEPRTMPGGVPLPLRELIGRCLARRPEDRISASELVGQLQPLVAELPRKLTFGRRGARAQ